MIKQKLDYKFETLSQENALIIADDWKYPEPYSFYDMTADVEDYQAFISEEARGDSHYQILLNEELIGFFTCKLQDRIAEIGIGMKPELTGNGRGSEFMTTCLEWLCKKHPDLKSIILYVAEFNERAVKLYKKLGFEVVSNYEQETNGGIYPFLKMKKDVDNVL